MRDLQRWNRLSGSSLKVGQALLLQGSTRQVAKTSHSPTYYKVRKGDSLYVIAKRFKVELDALKKWNPTSSRLLKPGQMLTLYLP